MKRITPQILLTAMVVAAVAHVVGAAEQTERYDAVTGKSLVRVDGTSTLHDWNVKSPNIVGHLAFRFDVPADASAEQVRKAIVAKPDAEAAVTISVRGLKSGKKDMDKKMYDALKADKHPDIRYKLTKLVLAEGTRADQEVFNADTVGQLTIAGVTKEYRMPMQLRVLDSKRLVISGETAMRMTDWKVKPPSAMLGAIKSGDKIKVQFEWNIVRADEDEEAPATARRG